MTTALPAEDHELMYLIKMEFLEMPDLQLTCCQAQRLWNLDPIRCGQMLNALVQDAFLAETSDGVFRRSSGNSR